MAEWLIAPVLKTGIVRNKELSRVRIPLSPFGRRMDFFFIGWPEKTEPTNKILFQYDLPDSTQYVL